MAGKSTLNRLERTPLEGPEGPYKKTVADPAGMDALLLEVFVEAHPEPPQEVILDVDATTIRCMGSRRDDTSTATTNGTATCHCTSFVGIICCVHGCAHRIEARPTGWWPSWKGL